MSNDITNAIFELLGGVLLWINVWTLYKQKEVRGVYWPTTAFFFAWGCWNIYYYPSLGQWYSFVAGIWLVSANLIWVILAIYYNHTNKKRLV